MLSVCLLNYNTYDDTIECIDSLLKQDLGEFKIIVVDNCSSNASVAELNKYFSLNNIKHSVYSCENNEYNCVNCSDIKEDKIFFILNSENKGYSAGNNVGVRFSGLFVNSDLILLLNNDTTVPQGFLSTLCNEYKAIREKENFPIAMGVAEYAYESRKLTHNGFHYLHLPTSFALTKPVFPFFKYICGACILIDKNAPLLDDSYFLYFDDIEYSKMLIKAGYSLRTTNKTHYFHKLSSSMKDSEFKIQNQFVSQWKFYKKHYPICAYIVLVTRLLQYWASGRFVARNILLRTFKMQFGG